MNIYISYFYKVRFMHPYEIPVSTAVWDPKWFHDFKGQDHTFFDKNNVLNGVRASVFAPGDTCSNLCRGLEACGTKDPSNCEFLRRYREQLDTVDFDEFKRNMESLSDSFQKCMQLDHPVDFVLLVHEAPGNPCSERSALIDWFASKGIALKEWEKHNG